MPCGFCRCTQSGTADFRLSRPTSKGPSCCCSRATSPRAPKARAAPARRARGEVDKFYIRRVRSAQVGVCVCSCDGDRLTIRLGPVSQPSCASGAPSAAPRPTRSPHTPREKMRPKRTQFLRCTLRIQLSITLLYWVADLSIKAAQEHRYRYRAAPWSQQVGPPRCCCRTWRPLRSCPQVSAPTLAALPSPRRPPPLPPRVLLRRHQRSR